MIDWLNVNAASVSALASVGSAFATIILMATTIVYAKYTWQLTVENRLLRKAGTDPQVVGYATINPRVFGAIDFVIRNIGKGAARNVSYKIVAGGDDLKAKNARLLPAGVTFAFLPQDEQLSETMGMGWNLLPDPPLEPFEIEICYEDMASNRYTARFKVDVSQFEGLSRLGSPPEEEIVENLKKIATVMERWPHQRLQVETMSTTERKARDEQFKKMIEERSAKGDERPS